MSNSQNSITIVLIDMWNLVSVQVLFQARDSSAYTYINPFTTGVPIFSPIHALVYIQSPHTSGPDLLTNIYINPFTTARLILFVPCYMYTIECCSAMDTCKCLTVSRARLIHECLCTLTLSSQIFTLTHSLLKCQYWLAPSVHQQIMLKQDTATLIHKILH